VLRKTQIWRSTPTDRPQESRRNRSSLPRERGVNKRSLSERSERPGPVALHDSKHLALRPTAHPSSLAPTERRSRRLYLKTDGESAGNVPA
jgi:hypothetical protein